jgi:NAD(P)-dependent dehydrogenase (short-subunit alcohol dehydrogenase family)
VLAGAGARLTILGRDRDRLTATGAALAPIYQDVALVQADVSDQPSVQRAFAAARDRFGDPLILVNNAGAAEAATFTEMTLGTWNHLIGVNLTGTFLCTQAALPGMIAAGTGRVINIASTAGLRGYRGVSAYCASKHGVVGLTRALAQEVVRQGITAMPSVLPCGGEMTERTIDSIADARGITDAEARKAGAHDSLGRLIRPEEVTDTVLWLCRPEASAITGQAIAVAGGEV